jgi:predicted lipoprotein
MREAVLAAFADCALSEVRDFGERAATLAEAARNHESQLSAETQTAAQAAWEAAIDRWQVLELFQFGPAAMSSLPGGQDIRSEIYIWPQFNRCLIEQIMVNRVYLADNFSEQFANARGLGALEYTLFYAAEENACPLSNPINSGGTWASLVAEGLGAAKAGYARAVAEDVQRNAAALVVAWDPTQGGFWNELAHAGRGSTVYPTTQAALNALSDALFYLDTEIKDMKLGAPIGLAVPTCGASICPDLVESSFAGLSKIHVKNNLRGFRKLFSGCADGEGLGFDDLLADVGQSGLADRMTQEIAEAIGAVDAIEEPSIQDALRTDLESVQQLHAAVKDITDLFKTDFFTVLNLDPPAGAGTDND